MLGAALVLGALAAVVLMLTPAGNTLLQRVEHEDSSGRTDLWRVAVLQFADEPLHGVGLGNYAVRSREYLNPQILNTQYFTWAPRTTHSTPLELLAELGVAGFALFVTFFGGTLIVLGRALRLARRLAPAQGRDLVGMGRGLMAAMAATVASSMLLSAQYQEILWVLLGLSLAYATIVERAAGAAAPAARLNDREHYGVAAAAAFVAAPAAAVPPAAAAAVLLPVAAMAALPAAAVATTPVPGTVSAFG